MRVYLNANAMLPTAVETSGPAAYCGYWSYPGDVTMRTWYSSWALQKGGLHYPMQWNIERNGLPDRMLVISRLIFDGAFDEAGLAFRTMCANKLRRGHVRATLNRYRSDSPTGPHLKSCLVLSSSPEAGTLRS